MPGGGDVGDDGGAWGGTAGSSGKNSRGRPGSVPAAGSVPVAGDGGVWSADSVGSFPGAMRQRLTQNYLTPVRRLAERGKLVSVPGEMEGSHPGD